MLRKFLLASALFLGGLLIAAAVISLVGGHELELAASRFSAAFLVPVLALLVAEALVSTWRWQAVLAAQGETISFRKLLPVWMAGNAFNYLSPIVFMGGEGVRVFMLKNRFNVAYHRAGASVVIDQLFNGASVVAVALAGAGVLTWYVSSPGTTTAVLFVGGIFVPVSLLLAFVFVQALRGRRTLSALLRLLSLQETNVGRFLMSMEEEIISFMQLSSNAFWIAVGTSALRQLLLVARAMFVLAALGQTLAWAEGLLALSGVYVSYALPVPLALGVQEVSQTALFALLGWGAGVGVLFSALYRAAELTLTFPGMVVLGRSFTEFAAAGITRMFQVVENDKEGSDTVS